MAAASARNEHTPCVTTTSEEFIDDPKTQNSKPFEVKVGGADGTSFSFSSQRCDCCPYGYHIDLDFLHFLDSLYNADNLKTLKRFKRGTNALLFPVPSDCSDAFSPNHDSAKETENMILVSDGERISQKELFNEVDSSVCRVTATCDVTQKQTTKSDLDRHLVSGVVTESAEFSLPTSTFDGSVSGGARPVTKMEVKLSSVPLEAGTNLSASGSNVSLEGIYDAESGRVSPTVLQAIREQLVVSLRRMKELEEQVKAIPILRSRISMLKEENHLLTLTTDQTFHDAAVGDFSVFDSVDSSENIIPLSPGGASGHRTVEVSKSVSHSAGYSGSDARDSVEGLSSVSLASTHSVTVPPFNSNLRTADACVNTDNVPEPEKEFKSVGILSKATTSDFCIGTEVELVDCGTGDDDIVSNNDQTSWVVTEQTEKISLGETVSESKSSELSSFTRKEIGDSAVNDDDTFTNHQHIYESNTCTSCSIDLERFKSVATQCGEDGNVTNGNDCIKERVLHHSVDFVNDRLSTNDKSTQTDDFLISEYASEILKLRDHEKLPNVENEESAEVTKKRITFGKVTIYEAETPNIEVYIINDDTSTDSETVSGQRNESESSKDLPISSYSPTQEGEAQLDSPGQSPVECIVIEQLLESPRCGESVIIYDSNESSPTTSDSEDSSALSVLEVIPSSASASISKAVKSVDEYFDDEGIAVEENSAVHDVDSEKVSGEEQIEVDEKFSLTDAKMISLVHPAKQEIEDVGTDTVSSRNVVSLDKEKSTGVVEISEDSVKTRISFTSDENPVNYETVSEDLTSLTSSEIHRESVSKVNGFTEKGICRSKVCDAESLNADDLSESALPATDHLEIILFQKKHPKHIYGLGMDSHESNNETENQRSKIISYSSVSDCNSQIINCGDISRSSAVKKKIIITETMIERRRIDLSDVEKIGSEETQTGDGRSSASDVDPEDLADDDRSRSENKAEYIHKCVVETAVMAHPEITEHAVEDHSGRFLDKNTDCGRSIEHSKINTTFHHPAKSFEQDDEVPKDDLTEPCIHREGSEDSGGSHSEPSQDTEKQFDGNICDAMVICDQWLQSQEGTDTDKISALDFVRKQWFVICGRKTSSATEVKTFLSLALSYSDALLQTIVNMADADGNTALNYAVSYSNTDVIRHLLDTGFCDVSHQNKAGYTAIMLAALLLVDMDRHRPIIERLFVSGNVNVPSVMSGQTALMLAASHGRDDTVQLLIKCGADVNAQDEDGSTALMCASEHGHIDIIKTLLSDTDCDSTLTDIDGSTALSIAMEESYQDIGVLLYAHMKSGNGKFEKKDDGEPESSSPKQ